MAAMDRNADGAMLDQALRAYVAATEIDPLMFDPLKGAGRIYVRRREHAKALGPLNAADQVKVGDPEVAFLIGVSYQELGQKKQLAIQWFERELAIKPMGEAAYRLGELYRDEDINKPADAQRAYAMAVRLGREEEKAGGKVNWPLTDAMYMLGRIANDRTEYGTAKAAWEQYVVRPDASRYQAHFDEARRALATSLKSVAPPAPEK
jgi:tetratricopeptide (TPR) repeat protein